MTYLYGLFLILISFFPLFTMDDDNIYDAPAPAPHGVAHLGDDAHRTVVGDDTGDCFEYLTYKYEDRYDSIDERSYKYKLTLEVLEYTSEFRKRKWCLYTLVEKINLAKRKSPSPVVKNAKAELIHLSYDVSPSSSPESSNTPIFDRVAEPLKQGARIYKLT